jgi:general secretion pathway protein H
MRSARDRSRQNAIRRGRFGRSSASSARGTRTSVCFGRSGASSARGTRTSACFGFSLIELMVVLVLIATATALTATVMTAGLPGQQLRGAAHEMAAQLRYTRAQAIVSGKPQLFAIDADSREWTAPGRRHGTLAKAIVIVATSARNEQPGRGIAAFRFFPDGSATGGRLVLQRDRAAWQLDIDWLTGQVTTVRAEATR